MYLVAPGNVATPVVFPVLFKLLIYWVTAAGSAFAVLVAAATAAGSFKLIPLVLT